ncbi:MAG: MFS transporter, partial [Neisseria sp.]|nr:MFS transporter [Neisseria sp.]
WKYLPESIPFLVGQGRHAEAQQLVQKLERSAGVATTSNAIPPSEQATVQTATAPRFRALWSKDLWRRSLMLWCLWFGIVFSYYGIFTWLPSLLVQQGFTMLKSFEYVL